MDEELDGFDSTNIFDEDTIEFNRDDLMGLSGGQEQLTDDVSWKAAGAGLLTAAVLSLISNKV